MISLSLNMEKKAVWRDEEVNVLGVLIRRHGKEIDVKSVDLNPDQLAKVSAE